MGLINIPNGLFLSVNKGAYGAPVGANGGTIVNMNAANKGIFMIGKVRLENPYGASKVLSGAGGGTISLFISSGTTFLDSGTTVRIGVQDVAVNGSQDSGWDVYTDLVGGTDTITSNTHRLCNMTSGTKTISNGDLIALGVEMTSRGGTDAVTINYQAVSIPFSLNSQGGYPYWNINSSGAYTKSGTGGGFAVITFDDGTIGWIDQNPYFPGNAYNVATSTFSSASTPDEYAVVWSEPFRCRIYGFYLKVNEIQTTDVFEVILYSDAEGNPQVEKVITPNAQHSTVSGGISSYYFDTPVVLEAGVKYAISIRPTTGNVSVSYVDLGSGNSRFKKMFSFNDLAFSARTNQTGAFVPIQDYHLPLFGLYLDQIGDGLESSGGGETSCAFA